MSGIYIHFPFCIRKCHYCDFYSIPLQDDLKKQFLESLKKEISLYSDYKDEIETIYIGGGTPSLLSASEVG
ncbi:MAG: radical SAM protein, partial [Nitrospirae bacterium]